VNDQYLRPDDRRAPTRRVHLTVDGRPVEVAEGATLLDAATASGVAVPHLCHDPRLAPAEVCRLCVVAIDGEDRLAPSCGTPAREGMVVHTDTPDVAHHRRGVLSMLAARYPESAVRAAPDAPLHRYFAEYGLRAGAGRPIAVDDAHPYIRVDMSRCIDCLRCVRICNEVQGQFVWNVWGRGEETRVVAGDGGTLFDSDCVSCGACADTCPTGAIEDRSVLEHGAPEAFTRTTCPYCGTGCEMSVGTRGGKIVQSLPVLDAKVSHGHLCVKGRYAFEFVGAPDRVTEPMIREHGEWRRASWEDATLFVARELTRIRDTHGPDSIGVLSSARATNEENYVAQKFARVVLGTNNVDCCARVCHAPTAAAMSAALGTGAATNSFADIEMARTFLVCGANPTEGHPIVGARIRQAVLAGAGLIVIDPRRTELAGLATHHLQVRPGGNVALLNAMAHVIVTEGLADEAFLRERVTDVDAFRVFIGASSPEALAPVTGVAPDTVRAAARLYAAGGPSMSFHGLGTTEHTQGTDGVTCLVNLALLTGNLGKRGAGVNPLRGQNNVQGAAHMGCEPQHLAGYATLERGRALFEEAWGAALPTRPGLDLMGMMDAAHAGSLHALWTIGYDVLLTNPNADDTDRAFAALDLVIVQDMFLNETARKYGTVFLPACSSFEKDGTFMNSERRVQRVRRVLPPVGSSRSDLTIVCDVARAMGRPREFAFRDAEAAWNEIRGVWPAGRGITYARLDREGGLQWPCPSGDHPGTELLHEHDFAGGRAPLARIPFVPTLEQPSEEFPLVLITGRTLHQFNAGTMTHRTKNRLFRPHDVLDVSPADATRLGLSPGQSVVVRSRYGSAVLPIALDDGLREGELFATFHTASAFLNRVTGPHRDRVTHTPEYKVVAVRLEPTRTPS
jgi:formate dehydrogenase major subunit